MMTLEVDEVTNTLVVMAPPPLLEEITALVASLDTAAAENSTRSVKLIPLKPLSADRMEKVLDMIIRGGPSGAKP